MLLAATMMFTQPLLAGSALEGGQKDQQKEVSGPSAQPEMVEAMESSVEKLTTIDIVDAKSELSADKVTVSSVEEDQPTASSLEVVAKTKKSVKKTKPLREAQRNNGGSAFGILALVFGLLGFLLAFVLWPVGLLFGITAIVLGAIGLGGGRSGRGMAVVGLILGILTIVIPVLIIALVIAILL